MSRGLVSALNISILWPLCNDTKVELLSAFRRLDTRTLANAKVFALYLSHFLL